MRILVLGGTRLVGRGFVEAALARGHTVTLFNRGLTHPGRFPSLERLQGDRDGDLSALEGRRWDAVFDPSASQPHRVEASLRALRDRVGAYLYVSSISVYTGPVAPGEEATAPRATWDGTSDAVTPDNYGGYKARCEDLVAEAFPGRSVALRLGLVVGPYDESERMNVWVRRVARGGEVLAPGDPDAPVQVIDGRDAGAFAVELLEQGRTGPYTVTGPSLPLSEVLDAIREGTGSDARFTWAPHDWLLARGLKPWVELPLWSEPGDEWFMRLDSAAARADGLRCRPLAETARDALAWEWAREPGPRGGLDPERERVLLDELAAERRVRTAAQT